MLHAILICIYVIEKCIPHSIVLLFTKKNERTVSDLNRQCLMRIIPIYWRQLDQRGIKGEEGGGGHGYYFREIYPLAESITGAKIFFVA